MKNTIEEYKREIRGVGLKATPQRIALLRLLKETKQHPSAEMLMQELEDEGTIMSVGTVYNILESFEEKGLIRKLHDNNEVMRFDANTDFHVHIFDKETNGIEDFVDEEFEKIVKGYLKDRLPDKVALDSINVSVYTQ